MRIAFQIYGVISLSFAMLTCMVAGFSGWPAGMERSFWHQLAFAAVSFLGALAFKRRVSDE